LWAAALVAGQLSLSHAEDAAKDTEKQGADSIAESAPAVPARPADPEQSIGGYDIWTTRDLGDGRWSLPVNLGPHVNSTNRELSPAVSADGELLYFASRGRGDSQGRDDIYVCAREGKTWGPAKNLGPAVNTSWEEIGPCPFPDMKTLLFCRRDPVQRSYDLAVSVQVEGEWLEAIGLGQPVATPGEERLPSITADGKELYFTAQWRSGRGGFDIWQSYRDESGSWSEPINLGPRINTRDPEYSPGISPDGKRLFFASQRGEGRNYDLYMSERKEGGTWQDPVLLPEPVASRFNEYCPAMAPDGKTLYFASDRQQAEEVAPEVEE
jgi:Tol biopolymer transport system component